VIVLLASSLYTDDSTLALYHSIMMTRESGSYIVMELCSGGNLQKRLEESFKISWGQPKDIMNRNNKLSELPTPSISSCLIRM